MDAKALTVSGPGARISGVTDRSKRPAGRGRCLPALLATIAVVGGCGESDRKGAAQFSPSQESSYCRTIRDAAEQVTPKLNETQVAELRRQVEESCRRGPVYAPAATPAPAKPFPGCGVLSGRDGPGPVVLRQGVAQPPERLVPFFSTRAGTIPVDGSATVGGVLLPRGSRCPHHWATDAPVPDAVGVAARLAAAFPQTGLWPVLWAVSGDDPDSYMDGMGNPQAAAHLDPEEVLRKTWNQYGADGPFPGLAPGPASADASLEPFGTLAQALRNSDQPNTGLVLLLVPCHRPADAISVLGPAMTEVMSDDALTAVLRSWEERFGAVLTIMGPGDLGVAVAPPRNHDQTRVLAAEQFAFAPEDDLSYGPYGPDLSGLARRLLADEPIADERSRHFWRFGWPD